MDQLHNQLRDLILSHRIPAGFKMPSTRRLCRELLVSRTVTLGAYEQLVFGGYLSSRAGSGHRVLSLAHIITSAADAGATQARDCAPCEAASPQMPFDPFSQATSIFPNQVWARLLARGWRKYGHLECRPEWGGLFALREAIADHLYALRGIRCGPEGVIVTAGSADALQLIARTFGVATDSPRSSIWVENPGHVGSQRVLADQGLRVIPIQVDEHGLNVESGIAMAPRARLALVTPARQFPLGMALSLPRRIELLNWALGGGSIVIEDDYDSEIRFAGRPLPSLSALAPDGPILSLGSLSKVTFPGLRLGYVVGPAALIGRLTETRRKGGALLSDERPVRLG